MNSQCVMGNNPLIMHLKKSMIITRLDYHASHLAMMGVCGAIPMADPPTPLCILDPTPRPPKNAAHAGSSMPSPSLDGYKWIITENGDVPRGWYREIQMEYLGLA